VTPPQVADRGPDRVLDLGVIPEEVKHVCRKLRGAGHEAHLVGGGVRDMWLGRVPADFDVATSAEQQVVMELFGSAFAIPTGLQHGTVTVLVGPPDARWPIEVTTFRGEGEYHDGRRPSSVTYVKSFVADLARRDFTMNALGLDPLTGDLTDPFDGRGHMAQKLVCAVGVAEERFREDGLRPMRAVRQATQLGFEIEPATRDAIAATREVFRKVSFERVRDEMFKLLASDRPSRGLELLRTTGLLEDIAPELLEGVGLAQNRFHKHDVWTHTLATVDETRADPVLRLGALLHDVGKPRARTPKPEAPGEYAFHRHEVVGAEMADAIARRWKLSTADRERVVALVAHHMFFYTPEWSDGTVRRFVRRVGSERVNDLFDLREGDVKGRGFAEDPESEIGELRRRVAEVVASDAALTVGALALDGREVMRLLQVPPGRHVGIILERLLELVLDDTTLNEHDKLAALLPGVAAGVPLTPKLVRPS